MNKTDKKITITRDGPYKVSGNVPLNQATIVCDQDEMPQRWQKGDAYHGTEGDYALCRCGRSMGKPYCDGAHARIGYKAHDRAGRPPYQERAERLHGPGLDLLDDKSLCVGARFCDRDGQIWNRLENADPVSQRLVLEEACDCPSGRLTVVTKDGKMIEPKLPEEISLVQDPVSDCRGPLWVKGGIPIEGPDGEAYERRNRVALCRCGETGNGPFCDGTHYECLHMQGLDGKSESKP